MQFLKKKSKLTTRIISDSIEIVKYLQIGISIPICQEFMKYILHDLEYFQAKSILLLEERRIIGNVLIYDDGGNTLYFGYFGVKDNNNKKIAFLINELLVYAKSNNFKLIRGPINIPTVIYGFGFMKKGSKEDLFVGKPVNPPIYQELFFASGFYVKFNEETWEGPFLRINPWNLKNYDFSEYEYFSPKDWNEFMALKGIFLNINVENFPPSSKITPRIEDLLDSYADYIVKYGGFYMFFFVKYKPTGKIIACGCNLPNPFRKNAKGNFDSIVGYSYAIVPEHRKKGILILMYGASSLVAWKKKMRYGAGVRGSEKGKSNTLMDKFAGIKKSRIHLILEYKF